MLSHADQRALASLTVFEALQPAAASTGVHARRVHYLYRDTAAAPCEVRVCSAAHAQGADADAQPPTWTRAVRDFRRVEQQHALRRRADCVRARGEHVPHETGPGFATGYSYVAPVVRRAYCGLTRVTLTLLARCPR